MMNILLRHMSSPAWVQGLLVFENLTGLEFLLVDGFLLLCELAPVFFALKEESTNANVHYVKQH